MTARNSGKRQIASSSAEDEEEYQLITKHARKSHPVDNYRPGTRTEQENEGFGQTKRAQDKRRSASKAFVDGVDLEEDNSQPRQERDKQLARQNEPLPPRNNPSDNSRSRPAKETLPPRKDQNDNAKSRPAKESIPRPDSEDAGLGGTPLRDVEELRSQDHEPIHIPPEDESRGHASLRDLEELRIQSQHQLEMLRIKNDEDVITLHREMWEQFGKAYVATGAFPRPRGS